MKIEVKISFHLCKTVKEKILFFETLKEIDFKNSS